jgi:hypothetical protein
MQYVIFLLLAMNGAYFIWQSFLSVPDEPLERLLPSLPLDIRRLVTIEERDSGQSTPETRNIEDLTAAQPPSAMPPLSCQRLGPFFADAELKKFERRLDRLGLTAIPQTRSQREQVGYAVLLTSAGYEKALENKRRLEKENITTSFIGVNYVLSLGAFRDKSRAEKILERAQALGLNARIEPSYAKRSTYWLVIQGDDNLDDSLAGLTRKYPDLYVENMACP